MYRKGDRKGTLKFGIKPAVATQKVLLAGNFNNWMPQEMKKQKDGTYVAEIAAPPGTYEYKFVIDGQWMADPDNAQRKLNHFGTQNSVASAG